MFRWLSKRRKKKRKKKQSVVSSSPVDDNEQATQPVEVTQAQGPTTITAEVEPTNNSASIGIQTEFSPVRITPSLLHPQVDEDEEQFGYETINPRRVATRASNASPPTAPNLKHVPMTLNEHSTEEEEEEEEYTTVTPSEDEDEQAHSLAVPQPLRTDTTEPYYTPIRKNTQPTSSLKERKEVSFRTQQQSHNGHSEADSSNLKQRSKPYSSVPSCRPDHNRDNRSQESGREGGGRNLNSLPSPRPPPAPAGDTRRRRGGRRDEVERATTATHESHTSSLPLPRTISPNQSGETMGLVRSMHSPATGLLLSGGGGGERREATVSPSPNLPVYSLDRTTELPSGDRTYLLTRKGPDGTEERFTATVITPSPSPPHLQQLQRSSSIPAISSTDVPLLTSTPIRPAVSYNDGFRDYGIHSAMDAIHPHRQGIEQTDAVRGTAMKRKKTKSREPDSYTVSTQTEDQSFYNKTAADSLRASLAQITSDLSTYSLNESDTELSLDVATIEQIIHKLPFRLTSALKSLNETVAWKDRQLHSHQNEIIRLREKCNGLIHTNQLLTKASQEQSTILNNEKDSLEKEVTEMRKERDELANSIVELKKKKKRNKKMHKEKVSVLLNDLKKLSEERDTFKKDLESMQESHTRLQLMLLEREEVDQEVKHVPPPPPPLPPVSESVIPFEEHKRTIQEFESLVHDIISTSRSKKTVSSLKGEALSMRAQLNNIQGECAALKSEQRDYESRIVKLQADLQEARARELMVATELTRAIKSSESISSCNLSPRRSCDRLKYRQLHNSTVT